MAQQQPTEWALPAQPGGWANPTASNTQPAWGQLVLDLGGSLATPAVYIDGYRMPVKYGMNFLTLSAGWHAVQIRRTSPLALGANVGFSVNVPANGATGFYYRPPKYRGMPSMSGPMPIKTLYDQAGAPIGSTLDTEAGARADRKAWQIIFLIVSVLMLQAVAAVLGGVLGLW